MKNSISLILAICFCRIGNVTKNLFGCLSLSRWVYVCRLHANNDGVFLSVYLQKHFLWPLNIDGGSKDQKLNCFDLIFEKAGKYLFFFLLSKINITYHSIFNHNPFLFKSILLEENQFLDRLKPIPVEQMDGLLIHNPLTSEGSENEFERRGGYQKIQNWPVEHLYITFRP